MNGKTHKIIGGLSAGLFVAYSFGEGSFTVPLFGTEINSLLMVYPAIIGGILPDIDMPNSQSGRLARKALDISILLSVIGGTLVSLLAVLGYVPLLALAPIAILALVSSILRLSIQSFSHRKETHYGLTAALLAVPVFYFIIFTEVNFVHNVISSILLGLWVGWFSHILADTFNKKGIPWLYPITSKHFYIATVKTGTDEEEVFRKIVTALFLGLYVVVVIL